MRAQVQGVNRVLFGELSVNKRRTGLLSQVPNSEFRLVTMYATYICKL